MVSCGVRVVVLLVTGMRRFSIRVAPTSAISRNAQARPARQIDKKEVYRGTYKEESILS